MTRPLHKRLRVLVPLLAALIGAGAAWAYWVAPSSGEGAGRVATLGTPSIATATPGAGTVALSWNGVTAPGAGSVAYYVTRDGGVPAGDCPTSTTASGATSCTDSGLSAGAHTYTVTAVYRSWSSRSAEARVTVTTGAVDHLVLSAASGTPTAGSTDNLTIAAVDSAGATVTSYTGTKSLTFGGASAIGSNSPTVADSSGAAVAFGTPEQITFTNGVATVSSTRNGAMKLYKAETAHVTVTDGTVSNGSGTAVAVSPGATSAFAVPAPSSATAGKAFEETITAVDQYGNTTPSLSGSKSMTFSGPEKASPNGKAASFPSAVTFTAGVGTATIVLVDAQTTTLAARERYGTIGGTSASFTVAAAAASALSIATIPSQSAGTPFSVTISAVDVYGNVQPSYEGTKAISFSEPDASPSGSAPEYPAAVTFTAGKGTASGITLYDAEKTTLGASDGAISGVSSSFTVNATSTPASLSLASPSAQTAGKAFSETITAKDAYGNTANYSAKASIAFSGPGTAPGGKAPSYGSVTFTSGTAPVTITLYDAQTTALTATLGTLSATSAGFTVNPASTTTLSFAYVSGQVAGTAFPVTLTAEDQFGNVTPKYEGAEPITWSGPKASPNGKAAYYPSTVTFAAGVGTAQVTLYDAAATTTLEAQQASSIEGSSNSFAVGASSLAALSPSNPGERTAGTGFSETLTAVDAYGNTVASYAGAKAIAFSGPASSPAGNAPAYPSGPVSFSAGVATAPITLYAAGATTLGASDGTYSGTSTSFTVAPASASSLSLSTPAPTAGTGFTETVTAKDPYGNVATGYSPSKTLSFSGPGVSPSGKAPAYGTSSFDSGVATPSITLYDASAATTLTAESGSLKASSASFAVHAGAAARLAWTGVSGSAGSAEGLCLFTCTWSGLGSKHTFTAKVSVTDANGNIVSGLGSSPTVKLEKTNSSATLSPSTLTIASSGEAISTAATTYTSSSGFWTSDTLTAKSSGYTEATATLTK